jgi:hypothetical protein
MVHHSHYKELAKISFEKLSSLKCNLVILQKTDLIHQLLTFCIWILYLQVLHLKDNSFFQNIYDLDLKLKEHLKAIQYLENEFKKCRAYILFFEDKSILLKKPKSGLFQFHLKD